MRRYLSAIGLLSAMIAAACTSPAAPVAAPDAAVDGTTAGALASDQATAAPVTGGSARVAGLIEPSALNPWLADAVDEAAATRPVLSPLWRAEPDGGMQPWLLAGEPERRGGGNGVPLTVDYDLRPAAVWSDGMPIDGRDLLFTIGVCQRLRGTGVGPDACSHVNLPASRAVGRRATVVFDQPIATWRSVLSSLPVLPEHLLRDTDVTAAWQERLPVSSGPFRVASWAPGQRLVLERNPRWWGDPVALDRIEVAFDGGDTVADLLDGRADVVAIDPTLPAVERARARPATRAAVAPSASWAVLDFNVASPRVRRAALRRAIAATADVETLLDEVIRPVTPAANAAPGLLVTPADVGTAPDATPAPGSETPLDDAGCPLDDDGARACDGDPLTLRLAIDGNAWHLQLAGEYVTSQLAAAGIVVVPADQAGWDIRLTTITPTPPTAAGVRWRCDAATNTQGYCDRDYDDQFVRVLRSVSDDERAEQTILAELILSRDRPTVPLYPVPSALLSTTAIRGPQLNAHALGPLWNTDQWARTAPVPTGPSS